MFPQYNGISPYKIIILFYKKISSKSTWLNTKLVTKFISSGITFPHYNRHLLSKLFHYSTKKISSKSTWLNTKLVIKFSSSRITFLQYNGTYISFHNYSTKNIIKICLIKYQVSDQIY